jgi:pyruvate formate lyase activating enzyme
MKGIIFNINRYAVHDGPGIRVTFFLKGCPLKCIWCHNPEGISPEPEEVETTERVGDREFKKREIAGKEYSIDDLLSVIDKEMVFIKQSKGGVTFSGGEPLLQHEFLLRALKKIRGMGYHTAIDTSGHAQTEIIKEIMPFADLFLYDIKQLNPVKHEEFTGYSNQLILKNLEIILENKKDIQIRIPVIPGFNDDIDHLTCLRNYLAERKSENIRMINLLPYHAIGISKYKSFRKLLKMQNAIQPGPDKMAEIRELLSGTGIRVKTGG